MRQEDSKKTIKIFFFILLLLTRFVIDGMYEDSKRERSREAHEELRAMKRASDPIMIITPDEDL